MGRVTRLSPEKHPWIRPDILPHAVASAGWGIRYPALCYEFGEPAGEGYVPHDIIRATLQQKRFAVAVWQPDHVTLVDISHLPERTFVGGGDAPDRSRADWANIKRYVYAPYGAFFTSDQDNVDPRVIMDGLYAVLATPLGICPGQQDLLDAEQPITRLLIEYPDYSEDRPIPLDTTIASLGGVATQKYLNTIYSPPKV